METFILDGNRYVIDELPEDAQRLARQAAMTGDLIEKLEARAAIARTAQARYLEHLKASIDKAPAGQRKK